MGSKVVTPLPTSDLERNAKRAEEELQADQDVRAEKEKVLAWITGVLLPVLFGLFATIFAIGSLQFAGTANDRSVVADRMALLSLCQANLVSKHA